MPSLLDAGRPVKRVILCFYYVYVARVVAPRSHYVIICISSAKCQNASHRIKEWQEETGC